VTNDAPGDELTHGVVFCNVRSWMTGCRLVSLPFSDHCDPLVEDGDALHKIAADLAEGVDARRWNYVELRSLALAGAFGASFGPSESYCFHRIDLTSDINSIYKRTHRSSIQQMIRKGERGLTYKAGNSDDLLREFYRLLILTRRRQNLPPQPIEWFLNLANALGDAMKIHVAYKENLGVASILTLHHKDTVYYKYGASEKAYANLGGTPLLMWKAIEEAHTSGARAFDMGRSDLDNKGLMEFKDRWGAERSELRYVRYPVAPKRPQRKGSGMAKSLFANAPDAVLTLAGRLLYRHFG
jgi:hypothetical protein